MLWVHGHYKYFNSFSAGTVFIRHNLTSAYKVGPRTERANSLVFLHKIVLGRNSQSD